MRTRSLPSIAVIALLATAPAVCLFAQPAPAPAVEAAAAPAVLAAPAPTSPARDAARNTLSVDFPDTDVRDILRNVADLFELNIVMPETLQGKSTIKLRDVTWRQIFQNVLEPLNYTYIEDGNIIKIVSRESINEEPVTTEVFIINYAKAVDILPTVTSLVDPAKGGRIVVDARSNSLVISERPTRISRIRPIIEQLDRATDQVMIESKFVEVFDQDVKNLGVNWSSLENFKLGVGSKQGEALGEFTRSRGQTIGNGASNNDSSGTDRINGSTSGTANSTSNSQTNSTGTGNTQTSGSNNSNSVTSTNGNLSNTSTTSTTGGMTNSTTANGNVTNGTTSSSSGGTTADVAETLSKALSLFNSVNYTGGTARAVSAVFNADQFELVLSALQSTQDFKVISNPTIVTLNNSQATINVGSERPIPNYTYNQERGSYEVSGFNYKQIGVILRVTPQVNSKGDIKLTLEPEVSSSNENANFNGAEIPVVQTSKATTQVSLKDGYTMGIGGLLTTDSTKRQSKVPVLGSVPVLGRLFRHDSHDIRTRNLIIFITAKTLSADGAPLEQVFDSERVRQLRLQPKDLPGYRDGTTPFVEPPPPAKGAKVTSAKPSRSAANK